MKIVFIGCRDITKIGGIENYMYNLTTHLDQKGFSCVVYCESDKQKHEFINGVEVYYWKSFKKFVKLLLEKYRLHNFNGYRKLIHFDYDEIWNEILETVINDNRLIAGAFVDWDNTPRNKCGRVFDNTSPEKFGKYIRKLINVSFV